MKRTRVFTATAFLIWQQQTLLHFHPKLQMWLPPGGHIEANETPNEAVLREVYEETGIAVVLLGDVALAQQKGQLIRPRGVQREPIAHKSSANHRYEHVDFIYFARPAEGYTGISGAEDGEDSSASLFRWYNQAQLRKLPLSDEVRQWCKLLFDELGHL